MSSNSLDVQNVSFSYKQTEIINSIQFKFYSQNLYCILGPSGSGKSTILNLIAGILKPKTGKIAFKKNKILTRAKVAYVFQSPSLIPWRTVLQNVLLGVEIDRSESSDKKAKAIKLLLSYGLEDFIDDYPANLSGGMQQRVSLIRAIMSESDILLLDEPFSNTDIALRKELQADLLKIVTEENLIGILVTHDLLEAVKLGDEIIVLSHRPAKIVEQRTININKEKRMEYGIVEPELAHEIEYLNKIIVEENESYKRSHSARVH